MKHPIGKALIEDTKLQSPLTNVKNLISDVNDNSMVLEAAKITQGGSGNDLCKALALVIKKILCNKEIDDSSVTINGIKTGTTQ